MTAKTSAITGAPFSITISFNITEQTYYIQIWWSNQFLQGKIAYATYLSDWEQLSREDYLLKKKEAAETFIQRLNDVYPGIEDAVDYYEIGTAKTIQRYTLNPEGSVYGFAQIPNQSGNNRFSPESSIKNLYFASAWTQPGGGFGAALGSGYMVANKILKKEKS